MATKEAGDWSEAARQGGLARAKAGVRRALASLWRIVRNKNIRAEQLAHLRQEMDWESLLEATTPGGVEHARAYLDTQDAESAKRLANAKLFRSPHLPLMIAAEKADEELWALLVERGADPTATCESRQTTLMAACAGGSEAIAKAAERAGVDPQAADKDGNSALTQLAARSARKPATESLARWLIARSDLGAKNINGWTALELMGMRGGDPRLARWIAERVDPLADSQRPTMAFPASAAGYARSREDWAMLDAMLSSPLVPDDKRDEWLTGAPEEQMPICRALSEQRQIELEAVIGKRARAAAESTDEGDARGEAETEAASGAKPERAQKIRRI
jgi:hypothetical protein